ncbi:hypothetical protein [Acidihalobacter ferrooxydans]|uniref:DUF1641 domain-containing protein n=1 Tax=Acidihalobacter ferrooxydans TaxID=1765967 RepID=A0A1P8UH93_9GAMM|nr:hypothetical protein [Acidihalobacter ferrooxydans]APZ43208.1 hypothetical protein BW247_08975 [Acidihalobacter ferrooxydans]
MSQLPPRQQQIVQAHAALIVSVVQATQNPQLRAPVDQLLRTSEENGWGALVAAIRRILNGSRDMSLFAQLDEEDSVIVEAILRGLQDPHSLPDPTAKPDPVLAAPGLAGMIHACTRGDVQALELLAQMAEQMTQVGGDMGRMGGLMRRLVEGERNPDVLLKGMSAQGESLVLAVLEELGKLEMH